MFQTGCELRCAYNLLHCLGDHSLERETDKYRRFTLQCDKGLPSCKKMELLGGRENYQKGILRKGSI